VAVASNVLNPAIIGDLFAPEERGSPMSLIMLAPLLGGAIGPGIAGAIVQRANWRHVMWMAIGLAGVAELAFFFLFKETYKVAILQRRAERLKKETGIKTLKTAYDGVDEDDARDGCGGPSVAALWESIKRPAVVFSGSFVLQLLSLYGCILFSFFYIMSTTLPDILMDIYHFDPATTGTAFMTFSEPSFSHPLTAHVN
jgi:MFS family permease